MRLTQGPGSNTAIISHQISAKTSDPDRIIAYFRDPTKSAYNILLNGKFINGETSSGKRSRRLVDKEEQKGSVVENKGHIQLGNFRFYAADHFLKIGNKSIALSEKETKALKIFAENIDQVVDREKLMKEIWEDEGIVVISRNVDVLVLNYVKY
jgi:hypothetical protein